MRNKGFSLLELLIVLAILAVFITIAYPGYQTSITRARRSDGQTALLDLANRLERYYSEQQSYEGATLGTGSSTDILPSSYSPQKWYRLVIASQTDTNFTIEAIPGNVQASDDLLCQTLTFNSLGLKGILSGPKGAPTGNLANCW